ncbi:hypothetical protein FSP39_011112, partial [Pinctada imbricata]
DDHLVSKEKLLITKLLDRYARHGRIGRPVVNTSDSINVRFGLSLIQILKVDEKNQVLETNVWETFTWTDILMTWNQSEHDNIDKVRVPSDRVWIPDIVLYNFADPRLKEQREAAVVVGSAGDVLWMPQAILRSSCQFDTTYFPFDKQNCSLKFSSWSYDGTKVDLNFFQDLKMFSLESYMKGTEWDIIENKAQRNEFFYECCPNQPYPDLTFHIVIQRKVAFYSFILILPCALLSLLTLVIFWVPPESPAKLVLGMNVFVAFFVLLLLLADSTPRAADSVPLIGAYFCLSMVMITMSTVLSTVVANMFFRGVRINRAPAWLRTLMIDCVARVFFIRDKLIEETHLPEAPQKVKCSRLRLLKDGKEEQTFCPPKPMQGTMNNPPLQSVFDSNSNNQNGTIPRELSNGDIDRLGIIRSSIAEDLRMIREILENYKERKEKAERKEKHVREWRIICCITDRLFFLLYLLVNIIGICIIFFAQ